MGVGYVLSKFYNSQERAEALVALGDLSSLKRKSCAACVAVHTFDTPLIRAPRQLRSQQVTVAYAGDRGVTDPDITLPKVGKTIKEVENLICDFAYSYVFSNGEWKVGRSKLSKFQPC